MLKGSDLQNRIAVTLEACKENFYTPQAFYQQCFPYFQTLQPEDYFSTTKSNERTILPEKQGDQYVLRYVKRTSKSSLKELADSLPKVLMLRLDELSPEDWNQEKLGKTMESFREDCKSAVSQGGPRLPDHPAVCIHFIRWSLTAGWSGPSISHTMAILGRETTLQRLANMPKITSTGIPR